MVIQVSFQIVDILWLNKLTIHILYVLMEPEEQ